MVQLFKFMLYLLREFVFDHQDEYNFKSARFNARKTMVFVVILLSFITNAWLLVRFFMVANQYWECQHPHTNVAKNPAIETPVPPKKGKRVQDRPSDSEPVSESTRLPTP